MAIKAIIELGKRGSVFAAARARLAEGAPVDFRLSFESARTLFTELTPARMELLDTVFAGRYLDAFAGFKLGMPVTKSWRVAFNAAEDSGLIGLQHLLLGMNADINLDLGIAAATVCPGPAIDGLRGDFDRINDVLAELLSGVQAALGAASPMLATLDKFCGSADESFAGFAMGKARKQAWRVATVLATLPPEHHDMAIALLDQQTATLGRLITRPDPTTRAALALIRLRESDDSDHRTR